VARPPRLRFIRARNGNDDHGPGGRDPQSRVGASDGLVGLTLGLVRILDARGRSPHVRSSRPPTVRPRGRGSLPRLPAERSPDGARLKFKRRSFARRQQAGRLPFVARQTLTVALTAAQPDVDGLFVPRPTRVTEPTRKMLPPGLEPGLWVSAAGHRAAGL
jgi:hypothetical protein